MVEKENMVLRTVYLPKALDLRLRELAFRQNISKAELIRTLVTRGVDASAREPGHRAFGLEPPVKISGESTVVMSPEPEGEPDPARSKQAPSRVAKGAKEAGAPPRGATRDRARVEEAL